MKQISFDEYYCDACADRLEPPPEEEKIYGKFPLISATVYGKESSQIVLSGKDDSNGYALSAMAFSIYCELLKHGIMSRIEVVTAVPIHRRNRRGYNQSVKIARELAKISGKRYSALLRKVRVIEEQKNLSAAERRINVLNAFKVRRGAEIIGKTVLIIDDICTTGSTLGENAEQLFSAGAAEVIAAVFAKTMLQN